MPKLNVPHRSLLWIIGLALALRLLSVAILPARLADDSYWYLRRGELLVTHTLTLNDLITFGPGYAVMAGIPKALFAPDTNAIFWRSIRTSPAVRTTPMIGLDAVVLILRMVQALLGALTVGFVWLIAHKLTRNTRIATIAGLGIALNPIFIIESNAITSETLFIFLLMWGLWVYINRAPAIRALAGTGALLGLATLTRAMLLLYPLGLAIHLPLAYGWKRAWRGVLILLLAYAAVVSTWTIYNLTRFNRLIIGADGMSDFLLMSVTGFKGMDNLDSTFAGQNDGAVPTDQQRAQVATSAVSSTIRSNPVGYVISRFKQLAEALLQPHQTSYFGGESLKELAITWLRQDRSLAGLLRVINGEAFWPKLSLYVAHYLCLIFGFFGILLTLRHWRSVAPLSGLILYTLLLHFVLLATPRYLFPLTPALWVFAGIAIVWLWDRLPLRRNVARLAPMDERVVGL